jgi:hypothetical protein
VTTHRALPETGQTKGEKLWIIAGTHWPMGTSAVSSTELGLAREKARTSESETASSSPVSSIARFGLPGTGRTASFVSVLPESCMSCTPLAAFPEHANCPSVPEVEKGTGTSPSGKTWNAFWMLS